MPRRILVSSRRRECCPVVHDRLVAAGSASAQWDAESDGQCVARNRVGFTRGHMAKLEGGERPILASVGEIQGSCNWIGWPSRPVAAVASWTSMAESSPHSLMKMQSDPAEVSVAWLR